MPKKNLFFKREDITFLTMYLQNAEHLEFYLMLAYMFVFPFRLHTS